MIAGGKFNAQINKAEVLLKKLDLFEERNKWVTYSATLPGTVRSLSYIDEFNLYSKERLFDIRLVDHAIFQFKTYADGKTSYCYYQTPLELPTYKEYVADQIEDEPIDIEEVGDLFLEDYEQVIATARLRNGVTPIRYDYNSDLYEPGVHPAAHLHIGSGNEIRLYTRRLMLPLSFVLFVLRQMYPESWRCFLSLEGAPTLGRCVRDDLEQVDAKFSGSLDMLQLILD